MAPDRPIGFAHVFGQFVRALRGGQSQHEFARRVGLPQPTISAIEKGGGARDRLTTDHDIDLILAGMGFDLQTALAILETFARRKGTPGFAQLSSSEKARAFVRRDEVQRILNEASAAKPDDEDEEKTPGEPER